jgi:3-hydroxybutyryl-CoA dehydrogenase
MRAMDRIGVVGCGTMGCGIAEVAAVAGVEVVVCEVDAARVDAGRARLESSLGRRVKSGKATEAEVAATLARVQFTTALEDLGDRELVIEAVIEDEAEKVRVFSTLDRVLADPQAILASNTSSYPIAMLGGATTHPERVVGMHFFNPVPVLPLVEVIPALLTSEATVARVEAFAREVLGKTTIRAKDRGGFIVNTLLVPFLLSAIRMFDQGVATAEDIDAGMVNGCAHPIGPLALSDLVGLDIVLAVSRSLYDEYKDAAFVAPPTLTRMVDAGILGRKSGRGFYRYDQEA